MDTKIQKLTEGNPTKLIFAFGLPVLVGNLFQQLYNIADSMIVGRFVGTDGLAAVGAVSSLQFFFMSFCMGMSSGIGIIIAQSFGANNEKRVRKSVVNGVFLAALVAVLMSVVGIVFAEKCLDIMGTPPEIITDATRYMQSTCIGILGIAMYNTVAEMLRALGDSRTPLYFLIAATLTNIVLDLIFIIGFDMGVLGAGVATATSQYLAAIGVAVFAYKKNKYFHVHRNELKLDKEVIRSCIGTGLPVACQFSLIAVSCIVMQSIVNGFGAILVATYTITCKLEQVVAQGYQMLTTALQAYSGQNIGAGEEQRVRQGFRSGMTIMLLYTLCVVPIMFFGGEFIVQCFVSDPLVIERGATALKIGSISYIFLGMIYVTRGILNGLGDTLFAFMGGVMEVIGRVCFTKPITLIPGVGAWGIWIATGLTWAATGILGYVRFKQEKWTYKKQDK